MNMKIVALNAIVKCSLPYSLMSDLAEMLANFSLLCGSIKIDLKKFCNTEKDCCEVPSIFFNFHLVCDDDDEGSQEKFYNFFSPKNPFFSGVCIAEKYTDCTCLGSLGFKAK
jgi:hypothetical protein